MNSCRSWLTSRGCTFCIISIAFCSPSLAGRAIPPIRKEISKHCVGSSNPTDVAQAQVEAYNRHDIRAFVDCYADTAAITDPTGTFPTIRGTTALTKHYSFLTKMPAEYGVEIIKRISNGSVVIDLERKHGLRKGQSAGPDSLVVYEIQGGKIVNVWFPP